MDEKSEQINIRASQRVARELRAEAQRRGLPLGETLEELLALARAEIRAGSWVELDVDAERALRSVAAAEGVTPETQLARMARGHLRARLMELAASIEEPGASLAVTGPVSGTSGDALLRHARARAAQGGEVVPVPPSKSASSSPRPARSGLEQTESEDDEELDRVGIFSVFE
jgi:hypothetical protein